MACKLQIFIKTLQRALICAEAHVLKVLSWNGREVGTFQQREPGEAVVNGGRGQAPEHEEVFLLFVFWNTASPLATYVSMVLRYYVSSTKRVQGHLSA